MDPLGDGPLVKTTTAVAVRATANADTAIVETLACRGIRRTARAPRAGAEATARIAPTAERPAPRPQRARALHGSFAKGAMPARTWRRRHRGRWGRGTTARAVWERVARATSTSLEGSFSAAT